MHPKLSITIWILSDQPHVQIRKAQDHSIIIWRRYIQDQVLAEPEVTCKLHEQVVHTHKSPPTITPVLPLSSHYGQMGEEHYDQLSKKKKKG